jgi:uncharacterized protein YecE (DUF72 family)
MADLRIGISGWRYAGWRGKFYPEDLPQRRELEFASRMFNSIEINGSFYSLQRPELYARWRSETPPEFLFAVKGGRYITHMKKLRGIDQALSNFFASGVFELREKLGPFLWQFPATLPFDERFEAFLRRLPVTKREGVRLARDHDARVPGFFPPRTKNHPLRHAVEVRSQTFVTEEFVRLLRKYEVGLVVADTAARFPFLEDVTAGFVYVRLHGDEKIYESGYSSAALDRWEERVRTWSSGLQPPEAKLLAPSAEPVGSRDVYVYFDNDIKVCAPYDARALAERLSVRWLGGSPKVNVLARSVQPHRTMATKKGKKKYGKKAEKKISRVMREWKAGTLRSGGSGKKVTSREQAVAIGISEARAEGAKVPPNPAAKKKTSRKKASKSASKKAA